jgi:glycosyltransferase A (GT-A) superfamily protein (DUF2064 family)
MTTLVVIAKECVPGMVKTRLSPPFSPDQAAQLASASLSDTLAAASAVSADRKILYFDGKNVPADAAGFEVVTQPSGPLDERLAHIFDVLSEPVFLVGMDTPQITAALIEAACAQWPMDVDAWFGPAQDGGFWGLGLAAMPNRGAIVRGVPMSTDDTGKRQLERLERAALRVRLLPRLTDIDTAETLFEVAPLLPAGSLSVALARIRAASQAAPPGGAEPNPIRFSSEDVEKPAPITHRLQHSGISESNHQSSPPSQERVSW